MAKPQNRSTTYNEKTLILGIHSPYNPTKNIDAYYQEFENLIKTDGIKYYQTLFIKLREVNSTYFLTKGKLEDVYNFCKENDIEHVFISEPITTQQARNLQDYIGCEVTDRTELILEIFQKAAHSAEGKTQVDIAILQHKKSRLAGKGIGLSQQYGVTGVRGGPGETAKEKELRHINDHILKLKKQLDKVQKSREIQRKKRLKNKEPFLCLIGYTNSGKSTILNSIAKGDVLAEDKLFATLDTTTRQLYINKEKIGLISDTVGFIQLLPHNLIEAFKSTLSELTYADLLLHVVDLSDPNWSEHIQVVQEILQELQIEKEILYVFNKVDKIENLEDLTSKINQYKPHVIVCAKEREGLKPLSDYLYSWSKKQ